MNKIFGITSIREIIVAAVLLAVLILVGIGIRFVIVESVTDNLKQYEVAYKTEDAQSFQRARDTQIGSLMAFGSFSAINPLSDWRVEGEYMALKVRTERYTMHTRTETYTDSNGNLQTRTVTEYSWDSQGTEKLFCDGYEYLGTQGAVEDIPGDHYKKIDTVYEKDGWWHSVGDIRWILYGVPTEFEATTHWTCGEASTLNGVWKDKNIDDALKSIRSNAMFWPNLFMFIWVVITIALVAGFIYLENHWLHDQPDVKTFHDAWNELRG